MHNWEVGDEMRGAGRERKEGEKEGGRYRRPEESGLVNNASALA